MSLLTRYNIAGIRPGFERYLIIKIPPGMYHEGWPKTRNTRPYRATNALIDDSR